MFSRNDGRPEGTYPFRSSGEDRRWEEFGARLWSAQKYFGSPGGLVGIRSSSEARVEGELRYGGLRSIRGENGELQRLEIEVTGEFHAQQGNTGVQYE